MTPSDETMIAGSNGQLRTKLSTEHPSLQSIESLSISLFALRSKLPIHHSRLEGKVSLGYLLLVALCLLLVKLYSIPTGTPDTTEALLEGVVDGDTIRVRINGARESVRLIGIDAPEQQENDKARRDAARTGKKLSHLLNEGAKSTKFLRSVVRDQRTVLLEFDTNSRDKFGRMLAYVYLRDGTLLNELLLKKGHARTMVISPNTRYAEQLEAAYRGHLEQSRAIGQEREN